MEYTLEDLKQLKKNYLQTFEKMNKEWKYGEIEPDTEMYYFYMC